MTDNRILVIDDEEEYRRQFYRFLNSEGYECQCVSSGEEAIEKIKEINYKVVILDLFLAHNKMTGMETLKHIRSINLDTCIIITTAYASVEAMFTAVTEGGAQTYIKKAGKWTEDLKITVKQGLKWINPIQIKKEERKAARKKKSIIKRCFLTGAPYCPWMIEENEKIVFVGMPFNFSEQFEYTNIYREAILPAAKELGFSVWRADEEMDNTVIMCKICRKIQEAKYAIVDISGWNVNVLFEFGLICGLGKYGIILKDQKSEIPTNLQGLEFICYDNKYQNLKSKIIIAFKKFVNS